MSDNPNIVRDANRVPAKMGVLCTDGVTLVPIKIDAASGGFSIDSVSTIGFTPGTIDFRNEQYRPCWMGVNSVDGTPIPLFVNADGAVLVDM